MRPASIDDIPLVDALAEVFSRYGYEGASLNRLSEASGLKRASLYHRYPGGKEEIVAAVVDRAAERFTTLLAPAYEPGDPQDRAQAVASGIRSYYDNGERSCLIVALSLSENEHRTAAVQCIDAWSNAFTKIAKDAGLTPSQAKNIALDAVAAIEGALVISATSGNTKPFDRALKTLPQRLTKPTS